MFPCSNELTDSDGNEFSDALVDWLATAACGLGLETCGLFDWLECEPGWFDWLDTLDCIIARLVLGRFNSELGVFSDATAVFVSESSVIVKMTSIISVASIFCLPKIYTKTYHKIVKQAFQYEAVPSTFNCLKWSLVHPDFKECCIRYSWKLIKF